MKTQLTWAILRYDYGGEVLTWWGDWEVPHFWQRDAGEAWKYYRGVKISNVGYAQHLALVELTPLGWYRMVGRWAAPRYETDSSVRFELQALASWYRKLRDEGSA